MHTAQPMRLGLGFALRRAARDAAGEQGLGTATAAMEKLLEAEKRTSTASS